MREFRRIFVAIRRFKKILLRALRRVSVGGAKREVALSVFLISLIIGYFAVWGIYSLLSSRKVAVSPQVRTVREIIKRAEERTREISKPEPVRYHVRVAIILDDAGGDSIDYGEIYSIREPLTISVLPCLKNSGRVVREAMASGKEAILHLPMEPVNGQYVRVDGGMILDSMSDEEIKKVVMTDLSTVPGVVGVNNHMGSRVTRDARVVLSFLSAIKGRGIFFIDSRTASDSIAYRLARENGIKSGRNELFLDVVESEEAVEKRFGELVSYARRFGSAIGIGHATRPATISALKKVMPEYERDGIEFVFASSLVK